MEGLDGLSGPYLGFAVAGTDEGVAVAQGAPDGKVAPQLSWFAGDGDEPVRSPVPSDGPLYDISTWSTGDEVAVIGLRCPSWTSASDPPEFSEDRASNARIACGSTDYEAFAWSPTSDRWRTLGVSGLRADNGIRVVGSAGSRALLARQSVRAPALEVLDAGDGSSQEVPPPPDEDGSAESQFTPCVSPSGEVYGALMWSGEAPPVVAENGWTSDVVTSGEAPVGSNFVALRATESGWKSDSIEGQFTAGSNASIICGAEAMVVSTGSGATTISLGDGPFQSTLLPAPSDSAATTIISGQGGGQVLAVERATPDSPRNPDAAQTSRVWRLRSGSWVPAGTVELASGARPFMAGPEVYALSPVNIGATPSLRIEA